MRMAPDGIENGRNQKWQVLQCLAYMRSTIPAGALIFTERETIDILAYYAGDRDVPPWPNAGKSFSEGILGGRWRVTARDYAFTSPADYAAALVAFRRQYDLSDAGPVWVVDGGWSAVSRPPDKQLPFSNAVRVFQTSER
jgi:hypothetical protein